MTLTTPTSFLKYKKQKTKKANIPVSQFPLIMTRHDEIDKDLSQHPRSLPWLFHDNVKTQHAKKHAKCPDMDWTTWVID